MTALGSIETFLARWQSAGGSERANYQLFITELCELLDLPKPEPAQDNARDNAYVFERRVVFRHGDGSTSNGFIDCYRRACFNLEAKKLKVGAAGTATSLPGTGSRVVSASSAHRVPARVAPAPCRARSGRRAR